MEFSALLNSYPGSYIVQSFSHSVIAAFIVEIAIKAWGIRNPAVRQRFLLVIIIFPIFSFPVYQIINPQRSSISFRLNALLDSSRWLDMELWGVVPVRYGFFLVFFLTAVIFFFQELVPILRHTYASRGSEISGERAEEHPGIAQALKDLPVEKADIFVLEDDDVVLFSTTGRKGSIYLSSGLLGDLDREQVRVAVAHEFAHVIRSRRPFLVILPKILSRWLYVSRSSISFMMFFGLPGFSSSSVTYSFRRASARARGFRVRETAKSSQIFSSSWTIRRNSMRTTGL